jgi:hypothetical protein
MVVYACLRTGEDKGEGSFELTSLRPTWGNIARFSHLKNKRKQLAKKERQKVFH